MALSRHLSFNLDTTLWDLHLDVAGRELDNCLAKRKVLLELQWVTLESPPLLASKFVSRRTSLDRSAQLSRCRDRGTCR